MRPTILHVEDDAFTAEVVRLAFVTLGFRGTVLSADSVARAYAVVDDAIERGRPLDLIITDMRLPDGSGLAVVRMVKMHPALASTPVLVLSNEVDPATVTHAYALGANVFISKTQTERSIFQQIKSLYGHWLQSSQLPTPIAESRREAVLSRAVQIRGLLADCYTELARRFESDPAEMRFWLSMALREANLGNLITFFRKQVSEAEIPDELVDEFDRRQDELEPQIVELRHQIDANPTVDRDATYRNVLSLAVQMDPAFLAKVFSLLCPAAHLAVGMLSELLVDHIRTYANWIEEHAENPDLRARAATLRDETMHLESLTPEAARP